MIANTIDAAPRRPAQEITRYCPIGGFDGASSKPTAAGRATNVKNNALASQIGGNGYLSVYLTGIILGNQELKNQKALVGFFDAFTGMMQMLLFFLLK